MAVGAANVAAGLFRGFAVAGGLSRGAVNFRAGAKTQLAGVIAAAVLALAVAFLTPLFFYLPRAALAAVVVVAVASLVDCERDAADGPRPPRRRGGSARHFPGDAARRSGVGASHRSRRQPGHLH
ncbi:MAG: SulP family inorganic anion transporter [Geodermatophilaceae bacterium]